MFLLAATFLFNVVQLCLALCSNVSIWIILSAQELEKDIHGPLAENISADKRLVTFDKIFSAYHDARGCIRADLVLEITWILAVNCESITTFLLVKPRFICFLLLKFFTRLKFLCFLLLKFCIQFFWSIFIILCILGYCRKCRKCERWFEWSW